MIEINHDLLSLYMKSDPIYYNRMILSSYQIVGDRIRVEITNKSTLYNTNHIILVSDYLRWLRNRKIDNTLDGN